MTTTPTVWKSSFVVNSGFTGGDQTYPRTIGLKNGNILVVWEDNNDINGPSPFTDVVGRIFDPEGNPVGNPFQVNAGITASDETGPRIVALPDGGYVVAYGGYSDADGGFIVVQRFNSLNEAVSERFITDTLSSLTDWEIAADSAGNYTVTFERRVSTSIDIHSITYDFATNAPGLEQNEVAQNSGAHDRLGETAAFGDGRIVTFYTEPDDWYFSYIPPLQVPGTTFEFTITNPLTGAVIRAATEIAEPESREAGRALDVAVLRGEQIVLLYGINRSGGELAMKIVANGTSNGGITPEKVIDINYSLAGDGGRGFENARVVALQDGGFLVAWVIDSVIYARRYDETGTAVGSKQVAAGNVAEGQSALSDLSLTGDGRVLITFINDAGEIGLVILDPRENEIHGTDEGELLTTQTSSTLIFGHGGYDQLLGQVGHDTLNGGTERDTLDGGGGNDTYILADLGVIYFYFDPVLGFQAVFGYDIVTEAFGGGIDTVRVRHVSPPNSQDIRSYALEAHVENGIIEGIAVFDLIGNGLANSLTGNGAANVLDGGGGTDRLTGNGGQDQLIGGRGNDILIVDAQGEAIEGTDRGIDTVRSTVSYVLGANLEGLDLLGSALLGTGNTLDNTIAGNIGANTLKGLQGEDTLTGRGGADKFDFTTALGPNNIDIITDFAVGVDVIRIDNAVFTGLAAGALPAGQFHTGAAAVGGNDHIIYNSANGNLYFDVDGVGGAVHVQFAKLTPGLALTAGDFVVI